MSLYLIFNHFQKVQVIIIIINTKTLSEGYVDNIWRVLEKWRYAKVGLPVSDDPLS